MKCARVETERGVRWKVRVSLGFDPVTGKRRQKWVNERTEKQCLRAAAGLLSSAATTPSSIPLSRFWHEEWVPSKVAQGVKPRTLIAYRTAWNHVGPALGSTSLDDLTPLRCSQFVRSLTDKGLSPAYVRLIHSFLAACLTHAVRLRLLPSSPLDGIAPPSLPRREPKRWTVEELRLILAASPPDELPLWRLLMESGMRANEALALRWQDIDLDAGVVTIDGQMSRIDRGQPRQRLSPKSGKTRRVPISPEVTSLLHAMPRSISGWVWANDAGTGPRTYEWMRHRIRLVAVAAGVPDHGVHALRHANATIMSEMGVPLETIQRTLGHATLQMTQHYARPDLGPARRAVQLLSDELSATSCTKTVPGRGKHTG